MIQKVQTEAKVLPGSPQAAHSTVTHERVHTTVGACQVATGNNYHPSEDM